MRRARVRVFKGPTGKWEWICRIAGTNGKVDVWCAYDMLAFPGGSRDEALASAIQHHKQHDTHGDLTLTYRLVAAVVGIDPDYDEAWRAEG